MNQYCVPGQKKRKSPRLPDPLEKLLGRITISPGGCWVHPKPGLKGYGVVGVNRRKILAHRFTYERLIGPIPEGMQIDHLCRNRACCNPEHLEPVTPAENCRRGARTGYRATHCKHGHPYTEDNLYVTPKGLRICRTCKRARWAKEAERKRARSAA